MKDSSKILDDFGNEEYLPSWIYESIVRDDLPWESGKSLSYEAFAERYTLHDSQWIGLYSHLEYENYAIAAFIWDAHWIPEQMFRSTPTVKEWPLLFIKLNAMQSIVTEGVTTLEYQREIQDTGFLLREDGVKVFVIKSDGGDVELRFTGDMTFLSLDRQKSPLLF